MDYIQDVIYSNQCPLGIEAVGGVQKRNKWRWFGYVERKEGGFRGVIWGAVAPKEKKKRKKRKKEKREKKRKKKEANHE